jgi:hypothetical protein
MSVTNLLTTTDTLATVNSQGDWLAGGETVVSISTVEVIGTSAPGSVSVPFNYSLAMRCSEW